MRSGGHEYHVPEGGWVTRAQCEHPDIHTTIINHNTFIENNECCHVRDYYDGCWGRDWCHHPYGFYWGDDFWLGYWEGSLCRHDYDERPIYVISPASGCNCGPVQPPSGGFQNDTEADLAVLRVMDTPSDQDPTAGLYPYRDKFDPQAPGGRISPEAAYNDLRHERKIYFHPPNGGFEELDSLDDLKVYLYSQENRQDAPPQS